MWKYEHTKVIAALTGVIVLSACDTAERSADDSRTGVVESAEAPVDPALAREASERMKADLTAVESRLDALPGLILSVRRTLRRHLNDEHIARARALGVASVDDTAAIHRLVDAGQLVLLPDSTRHWIVRELDQSLPYVTPDKLTALEELGDRFHARLTEAGLPPFRFEISSALRTGDLHLLLRARNANASQKESSHEFGTTVDIAYNEFSAPTTEAWASWHRAASDGALGDAVSANGAASANDAADELLRARLDAIATAHLDSLGNTYSDHLKGELGAVLDVMQDEGRLWPLYERSQPVFHTTLAGRSAAVRNGAGR
jgi:hypothetical protein